MEKAKAERIFQEICQNIGGDWLLVGGTLVQLQYEAGRSTEDIDLVQISHPSKSREVTQNELFQFTLRELGFGPEYINLAVEFFIKDLVGWEKEILPFKSGAKGKVFRPSLTLFCALKAKRGSELDQQDIQAAIQKEGKAQLDLKLLRAWLTPGQFSIIEKLSS